MEYESSRGFLVTVIDDDQSVRESVPELLRESGYEVEAFPSAEEFLVSGVLGRTKCLVLDIAMPRMTGPELHRELQRRGRSIPVIFITAHGDETMRPRLRESGAVDCLFKPFSDAALLAAIGSAFEWPEGRCDDT